MSSRASPPEHVLFNPDDCRVRTHPRADHSAHTCVKLRGYWPQHTDEPAGAYLDEVQKCVVSSSMTDPQWHNSTLLSGDPLEEVRRLKDSDGGEITLSGSITLAHAVLAAGLVDEIRLLVFPAVQGRGRGLVPEGTSIPQLELLESQAFRSGVVLLRYAVRRR